MLTAGPVAERPDPASSAPCRSRGQSRRPRARRNTAGRLGALLLPATLALWACDAGAPDAVELEPPVWARGEITESLRADLTAVRSSADGGGRAWLESQEPAVLIAGSAATLSLAFETGPEGIVEGGTLLFQVDPFWGWSTPQVEDPQLPGYTTIDLDAAGAGDTRLEAQTVDQQLLAMTVRDGPLPAGSTVRLVYGAGPAGAIVDRFAESESPLWFAVDGDGDGIRALVEDSPTVEIRSGPAAQLHLVIDSTSTVGGEARLTVAALDYSGNAGAQFDGFVLLAASSQELELPQRVELSTATGSRATLQVGIGGDGIFTVAAESHDGLFAVSNPLTVAAGAPRILWADLHGHSALSDGTGSPAGYYTYARDVAALDVAALTDHDHWGLQPLATHEALWARIRQAAESFNDPPRFVTLLGYEWTSWIWGHRHVLYFEDHGEVLSSVDPDFDTPQLLWQALRGQPALTFAHHSAGGPIAVDWRIPPDPELEPVTEIVSVHGASEAADAPASIYRPEPGNYVRDAALGRGYRLGFIGSGDSHDGHPGLAHLGNPSGGLAAILSEELSRESVLAALRERRVYATNGPRIVLRTSLDGRRMGEALTAAEAEGKLHLLAVGTEVIEQVDVVRSGEIVATVPGGDRAMVVHDFELADLAAGEWVYVRVVQVDGGAAWSSPFFID